MWAWMRENLAFQHANNTRCRPAYASWSVMQKTDLLTVRYICIYVLSIQYFIGAAAPLSDHRQLIDISSSAHVSEHWNIDNNITLNDSKYTIKNGER